MTLIESPQNPRVKAWQKLAERKERLSTGLFLAEGHHIVHEAIAAGLTIEELILRDDEELPPGCEALNVTTVTDRVMRALSQTETPQGIAAVCRIPDQQTIPAFKGFWLLLDAVQDPGNVGALIRTADAAGCTTVVCGEGCAGPWGSKALRATQGSIFHLTVLQMPLPPLIHKLRQEGVIVFATDKAGLDYRQAPRSPDMALVMGNEGAGITPAVSSLCDEYVSIPISGRAESLNVSVAAGILLFHFSGDRP